MLPWWHFHFLIFFVIFSGMSLHFSPCPWALAKKLLIISQITPSAICVLQQEKLWCWCLKACEQLARSGLFIMFIIISLFLGTLSSDLSLIFCIWLQLSAPADGTHYSVFAQGWKSWYEEECCRTGTTLDYNLSNNYRDDLIKSGPAFIRLSLNARARHWGTGIFF